MNIEFGESRIVEYTENIYILWIIENYKNWMTIIMMIHLKILCKFGYESGIYIGEHSITI